MKLELGTVIAGKYRVEKKIGEGGMATIFRCIHMDLDRPVAIKFLSHSHVSTEAAVERFLNEARVAASVRHRHVVDVLDFGTMENGTPFMVMELLEGGSFAERLTSGEPMHVSGVITLIGQALSGLGAVHAAGIVHRDVKPENIFLVGDDDGEYAKLLDFGISRAGADSNPNLRSVIPTFAGHLVGTPQYMSPEQARGLKRVDHRTDIYSMGVVLYEALTGKLPFDSEFYGDVLVMITTQATPLLSNERPDLGQPLSDVVERAMARDPAARFQSAREMRDALLAAVDQIAAVSTQWVVANAVPIRQRGASSIPAATIEQPVVIEMPRRDRRDRSEARQAAGGSEADALAPGRARFRWALVAAGAFALAAAGVVGALFGGAFFSGASEVEAQSSTGRSPERADAPSGPAEAVRAQPPAAPHDREAPAPATEETAPRPVANASAPERVAPDRLRGEARPLERHGGAPVGQAPVAGSLRERRTERERPRIRRVIGELDF